MKFREPVHRRSASNQPPWAAKNMEPWVLQGRSGLVNRRVGNTGKPARPKDGARNAEGLCGVASPRRTRRAACIGRTYSRHSNG